MAELSLQSLKSRIDSLQTEVGDKLGSLSKAVDSNLLDGHDSTYFSIDGHAHAYSELTGAPLVPTKLSELTNDTGFITSQRVISDSVTSTSNVIAASSIAAKTAYDKGVAAYNLANGKLGVNDKAKDSLEADHAINADNATNATNASYATNAGTVNSHTVLSNVPTGAKFTDTTTTINGKTGTITKTDITALGIPASQRTISNSVTSTSTTTSASSSAVKSAYDKSIEAYNLANGNNSQLSNITTQIGEINVKLNNYSSYVSGKDSNGIYTVIDYKRLDSTLYMKSTLSGGTSPLYTTVTWQFYNDSGTTVIKIVTWTITYDENGEIISKVVS